MQKWYIVRTLRYIWYKGQNTVPSNTVRYTWQANLEQAGPGGPRGVESASSRVYDDTRDLIS